MGQSSEEDDVDSLCAAGFLRKREAVEGIDLRAGGFQLRDQIFRIDCRAGDDGHRVDLLRVGDDLAVLLQVREPARRLKNFKGYDKVRFPEIDDR